MDAHARWHKLRPPFLAHVAALKSDRAAAREIGIAPITVSRLREDSASVPQEATLDRIERWLQRAPKQSKGKVPDPPTADGEILQYLMRTNAAMGELLGNVLRRIKDPTERKLVALEVLHSFKRSAIEMGRPIPRELYELEERFLAGDI